MSSPVSCWLLTRCLGTGSSLQVCSMAPDTGSPSSGLQAFSRGRRGIAKKASVLTGATPPPTKEEELCVCPRVRWREEERPL